MTTATFKSLDIKAKKLMDLLDAEGLGFGHNDGGNNFFIEIRGQKRGANGLDNGGNGYAFYEFESTRELHNYFNDKIRLFGSN